MNFTRIRRLWLAIVTTVKNQLCSRSTNFCSCDITLHNECLPLCNEIRKARGNNGNPSAQVIFMYSHRFTFTCRSCRNGIISQNTTTLLSSKLNTILIRLNGHSLSIDVLKIKLTEINIQQNDILSYAKTFSNSPTSNMHQPFKKDNTKLNATQLFNYNTTEYNINAIVIENVKPINNLNIDSNNIYNTTINKNNQSLIIFNNVYFKKNFLYTNSDLQNTDHKHLFIRNHLSLETLKHSRILYHAVKTNSISNRKATFNKHNNKYELREITDNKTNWSKSSLFLTSTELKTWTESYNAYIKNKKEHKLRQ